MIPGVVCLALCTSLQTKLSLQSKRPTNADPSIATGYQPLVLPIAIWSSSCVIQFVSSNGGRKSQGSSTTLMLIWLKANYGYTRKQLRRELTPAAHDGEQGVPWPYVKVTPVMHFPHKPSASVRHTLTFRNHRSCPVTEVSWPINTSSSYRPDMGSRMARHGLAWLLICKSSLLIWSIKA